jgi:hypothetical protein
MDNYEKARELLNKHLNIHGGDSLGITDGNIYRAVIDAIDEALRIHDVVGRSEQLPESEKLCRMNQNIKCNCIDDSICPNF